MTGGAVVKRDAVFSLLCALSSRAGLPPLARHPKLAPADWARAVQPKGPLS